MFCLNARTRYFRSVKWIYVRYFILCIFIIFMFLSGTKKSSFPPINRSSPEQPLTNDQLSNSHLIQSPFQRELISQCLLNHRRLYENSSSICETARAKDDEQNRNFNDVLKSLNSLRQQIVPYPNDYFHGRGVVLTVGQSQLPFARVNLKMLEFSGTQLPVQVNILTRERE